MTAALPLLPTAPPASPPAPAADDNATDTTNTNTDASMDTGTCNMSWNEVAIQLSNQAMDDLHDRGDLLAAYLNLSGAVTAIGRALPLHHHEATHDAEAIAAAYSYSWVKCSTDTIVNQLTPEANEGYLSFMCLRFLRIKTDSNVTIDHHCPCQFSWAVYYNVGILCTVLGTIMGRQVQFAHLSVFMLQQGRSFMDSVLVRVEAERPDNKDWATVHLSILVNQALGDLEGRIAHNDPQPVNSTIAASESLLKQTRECLQAYSRFFAFDDLMEFYFSLQPFMSNHCAQAA